MFNASLLLTTDFMVNDMGYERASEWGSVLATSIYKDYYMNACAFIHENFYLKPTTAEIESFVLDGEYTFTDTLENETIVVSTVEEQSERIYLFKAAMAKQLIYDVEGGRGSMIRGEDERFNVCFDFISRIKMLGLYQRTAMCV